MSRGPLRIDVIGDPAVVDAGEGVGSHRRLTVFGRDDDRRGVSDPGGVERGDQTADLSVDEAERGCEHRARSLPVWAVTAGLPAGRGQLFRGGDRLKVHAEKRRDTYLRGARMILARYFVRDSVYLVCVVALGKGVVGGPAVAVLASRRIAVDFRGEQVVDRRGARAAEDGVGGGVGRPGGPPAGGVV